MAFRLLASRSAAARTLSSAHEYHHGLLHQAPSRNMSATAAPGRKFEWLVVVPDLPGVLEKRLAVRSTHFANMKPNVDSGAWTMGGALLTEVPKDDDPSSLRFAGSTLVCMAESKEEIIEMLKKDIYGESGVWDIEKVQMWPFKRAFMKP